MELLREPRESLRHLVPSPTKGAIGSNGSFWTARSHEWLQGCVVLIMGEWLLIWSQNGSFSFVCVGSCLLTMRAKDQSQYSYHLWFLT